MTKPHFPVTQAAAIAAVTWIVGQLAAFVPAISNDQQNLTSAGTTAVVLAFLIANAVHHLAAAKTPPAPVITAAADPANKLREQVRQSGMEPVA